MSVPHPHERRPLAVALLAALSTLAVALACACPARAESIGEKIILRCTHGESLAGFSQHDYQQALEELTGDSEEYSPCAEQIREAEVVHATHAHGGAAAAAEAAAVPLSAAPSELASLQRARRRGSGAVNVGGGLIRPGVVHANVASALSTLPAPLLAILAVMAAGALAFAAVQVRRRVRGRRPH